MLNNIAGILAPQVPAPTNSYESIESFTVGAGGTSSITFGSGGTIPQTYKHLQIRFLGRNGSNSPYGASALFLRINGDTSSTYWNHGLYGTGSTTGAFSQSNTGYMNIAENIANDATANIFTAGVIDILDYANTNKNKTVRSLFGVDKNGSGNVDLFSGSWTSTSAITSLTLIPQTSPFQQYSTFALYGIKG